MKYKLNPEKAREDLEDTCELMALNDELDQAPESPLTEEEIERLVRRVVDGNHAEETPHKVRKES